tara:strand:- start:15898 stop:16566 length:669 start_codon:yes stop_codon:yes gene_type:complete
MIDEKVLQSITATTLPTGRTYHTPDGDFSSITTILGKTANQEWLTRWREKVGEEEAARISKEATSRGEAVHNYLERYWNGEDILPEVDKDFSYKDIRKMTKALIRATKKGVTKVIDQEIPLWHPELGAAGRVDLVGHWKDVPAIVDFKTSKKKKYASSVKDYFLQVAFYAEAYNYLFDTDISKLVILITVEDKDLVQAFYGYRQHYLPDLKYRINQYNRLIG